MLVTSAGCRSRQVHRGGCTGPLQAPGSQRLALGQCGIVTGHVVSSGRCQTMSCHESRYLMKSHGSVNCNRLFVFICDHARNFHDNHQTKCDVVPCVVISCYAKEVVMSLQWRMSWARC